MAGTKIKDEFKQLISPFLNTKMEELKSKYGENSAEYRAISKQYISSDQEKNVEASLESAEVGKAFQFEREGYFCLDKQGTVDQLIFNRTVALRESWVD